ncbi:MAG: TetR/AcrR family transcriptional regulator [Actinobacteria bacterium]|nr:TetR/AcrR family transcriptional regulator [Actinomycetota bacterium]
MSSESSAGEGRVNPRTRRVRGVILSTAVDVLLERGAHDVTAARVAEQADVARTTIYRYWPDQRTLLLATIDALTSPDHQTPTVGRIEVDVRTVLGLLRTRLVTHDVVSVFGALSAYAARDNAFSEGQRRFVEQLTRPTADVLTAAQGRGALGVDVDCQLEASLLAGPLLHQHLVLHSKITDGFIDEITRRWLTIQGLG